MDEQKIRKTFFKKIVGIVSIKNFLIAILSLSSIFLLIMFSMTSSYYQEIRAPFIEVTSNFEGLENVDILMSYKDNIIVRNGEKGNWDENIREIGNIIYRPTFDKYYFFYSGYKNEYDGVNVFVGMACSDDGKSWHKSGKIIEVPSEDPYVILHDDMFFLFFEDKSEIPFRKINLATSDDGENWTVIKQGVIQPTNNSDWQSQDVSSPVVIETIDGWVMLYEGRGSGNLGKIGYASSNNLLDWNKSETPIFEGSYPWANHVVPDDIIQEDEYYFLTYHGFSKKFGWQNGLAISTDFLNWRPVNSFPIHPTASMLIKINSQIYFFGVSDKGVEYYIPLKGV